MVAITEKRFLQLLLILPVVVPVISIPLCIVPLLSLVPMILFVAIWYGGVQYALFCIIALPLITKMHSTKDVARFYIFSPLIYALIFYVGVKMYQYIYASEEYFGYHIKNMPFLLIMVSLICYFYVGVGKLLYDLFLKSKYLKN